MNFLGLCKSLAVNAGIGGGSGPVSVLNQNGEQARVVEFIRESWLEIQGLYVNWKFLWSRHEGTILSGNTEVLAPADLNVWDYQHLWVDGQRISSVIEYEDYMSDAPLTTGKPMRLVEMPDKALKLLPVPGQDYPFRFDYFRTPQILVNDNDAPLCPPQFHDVIVKRAMQKYGHFESAPEVLSRYALEYQDRLKALMSHQLPQKIGHVHSHDQGFQVRVE